MKTVTVLSDTHGNRAAIDSVYDVLKECDYIIHLGDTSQDGNYIKKMFPQKTYLLNGNCDLCKLGEDELVLEIENVKIFACHGHMYSVKSTLKKLAERAAELGCTVALYGHSHRPSEEVVNGVLTINPGNMTRYSKKSYSYLIINDDKAVQKTVYPDERNV